jgi:hypothetical protein
MYSVASDEWRGKEKGKETKWKWKWKSDDQQNYA